MVEGVVLKALRTRLRRLTVHIVSIRIAMWSGPRNISTAMMRAWGNRDDTFVCDAPLYAHYLNVTGRAHQGAAEVIGAGPTNLNQAIAFLLGPVPGDKTIFYQK